MQQPLIEMHGVTAGYDDVPAVRDISLRVSAGQVVVLLGANGAGKSTTLRTLAGSMSPMSGTVIWRGKPTRSPLHRRSRDGLRMVGDDRGVFMSLTVAENIQLLHRDNSECLELFPELKPLLGRKVGLLSGGEQQMLALGRALSGNAKLLLADEVSLGLAPMLVDRLLTAVRASADRGVGVLLVEQQIRQALGVADFAYVLRRGLIVLEGPAADLRDDIAAISKHYLGDADLVSSPDSANTKPSG